MPQIDALLSDLQTALRKGDFTAVSQVSAMLETFDLPKDPATLRCAARIAGENAALLAASANGLRAAQRRLAALRSGPRLTTYDGTGRRVERFATLPESKRI